MEQPDKFSYADSLMDIDKKETFCFTICNTFTVLHLLCKPFYFPLILQAILPLTLMLNYVLMLVKTEKMTMSFQLQRRIP